MKINVFSYKDAEEVFMKDSLFRKNWISIRDIGFDHLYQNMDKHCSNILRLHFDDVTRFTVYNNIIHPFYVREQKKRDLTYFDERMANEIILFAKNVFMNDEMLNVHCWAGKSRSQAIGYCLNEYFNLYLEVNKEDFEENLKNNMDEFLGNFDVIRIITKELYK